MQVAVQPEVGLRQPVVQRVAEARGARAPAIARVHAVQRGCEMRDHHRGAVEGLDQRLAQPALAVHGQRPHRLGVEQLPVALARHLHQVVVGGAKGLVPLPQHVVVAPQRGADEAHALHHARLALQPQQAQAFAGLAQALVGLVHVQRVVLVVARHEQHRHRPPGKALQAPVGLVHHAAVAALLVRTHVAREHQQVGARRGLRHKVGVGFEVQVAEQLDVHARIVGQGVRPWPCGWLSPAPWSTRAWWRGNRSRKPAPPPGAASGGRSCAWPDGARAHPHARPAPAGAGRRARVRAPCRWHPRSGVATPSAGRWWRPRVRR
eukprot:Opistho-1_new@79109